MPTMGGAAEETPPTKLRKKPRNSRFTQQNLKAWRPVLTPVKVVLVFMAVALVLIPVGVACLTASISVVEYSSRYDNVPECTDRANDNREREQKLYQVGGDGFLCNVSIIVEEDMKAPIFMYYELDSFFQNHRRYVKGRDDEQLKGKNRAASSLDDCEPRLFQNGSRDKVINPCGLTAWSFFNDTFRAFESQASNTSELGLRQKGIAWRSDVEHRFGAYEPQNFNNIPELRGGGEINGLVRDDEHFVVWMRTAPLPTFRKLWGIIDRDVLQGSTFVVEISNRYNTYRFGGKKSIILSTTSWLGGKNNFLGFAYIVAGGLSFLLGTLFFVLHLSFRRPLGSEDYLSWRRSG
ncbi:unnamed protein product [Ostreobium quekettii]|uniref:ALA-interacting subunit n=1 Tax=Ostreobium quekettii TaxID=121088 RepID=A0A8S1ISJ2_9CHLO|nr:unnamed protein product [Ostreobium quekettii]